ncbi:GEVED domain-containing protein [Algivirga pacifica]|uniref:Fibronectin type-III domain-containing protein n=1 Tax=Algivirga pacifica TaxID=1162670 RepID=A0ABP9CYX4_9BACT
MKQLQLILVFLVALLSTTTYSAIAQKGKNNYAYSIAGGTPNSHGSINTSFATLLAGGAEAGAASEVPATQWFLNHADGGDYLVIRTGGTGSQASWIWSNFSSSISSAAELSIDNTAGANDPTVAQYIRDAEAVFIAGGDQTAYMNNWKGTEVEAALNYLIQVKKVPIGGTSAGMAILGGAYYAPASSGILSSEILDDPYHPNTTNSIFYNDFLEVPYLENVITDTHLDRVHGSGNENRYGRIFGLLARTTADTNTENRYAIGCDEGTFVGIDANGIARVFGDGGTSQYPTNAYFVQANCSTPETISNGSPLVWNNGGAAAKVYVIQGSVNGNGNSFDLNDWTSVSGGGWMDWFTSNGYSGFNYVNGNGATIGASSPSCNGGGTDPDPCTTPHSLSAQDITAESATLSWANTGAQEYELNYRIQGDNNWTIVFSTPNSYTLNGLIPETTYEFQVKANCGSASSTFSTTQTLITATSGGNPVTYCDASATSTQYEYIDEVKMDNSSNLSGDDNGYGDYTNVTFNLSAGNSHTVTVYPSTSDRERFIAWIDFNQDGDFDDAGEEILYASSRRSVSSNFTVPTNAKSGDTRMRVAMQYASDGTPTSCGSFTYGEVEDYTISIQGGSARWSTAPTTLSIYPNPSTGIFTVNSDLNQLLSIEVYQLSGKKILTTSENTIDLTAEKSGLYLVKVYLETGVIAQKILKQ